MRLQEHLPHLLALNETFLNRSIGHVAVSCYSLVSRRDRRAGDCERDKRGGGIALFALSAVAQNITLLQHSESYERSWHILHADLGPILFCIWYRPPCSGEVASIASFEVEWARLAPDFIGTIVVGDLNVHHTHWLRHSTHVSVEGTRLYRFCIDNGFRQCVSAPTRGDNTLDLVLTDLEELRGTVVGAQISDHRIVRAEVNLSVPRAELQRRVVYDYKNAAWTRVRMEVFHTDWSFLDAWDVDRATAEITRILLCILDWFVPKRVFTNEVTTHPWLNDRCLELIRRKRLAEGTADFPDAAAACSAGILFEYHLYIERTRMKLRNIRRGSKAWWRLANDIMHRNNGIFGIPALKRDDGSWERTASGKAELLADVLGSRYVLPEATTNAYTWTAAEHIRTGFLPIRVRMAIRVLRDLSIESATGPDNLGARFLKECFAAVAHPLVKLARRILSTQRWPQIWTIHWITALFKRGAAFLQKNYRGIHLTAQMSKLVERMLASLFVPQLSRFAFGDHQFAYRKEHGARDALALYVLHWILAFNSGNKVGIYCSDVAGAFDRVSAAILLRKLRSFGLNENVIGVIQSWLRDRQAFVVVGRAKSRQINLSNMVFQGTVWGPCLWNAFFGDSVWAVRFEGFDVIVFADDLNAFKEYPLNTLVETIVAAMRRCQLELHKWGAANQAVFDAGKEHMAILSHIQPMGEKFRLLGVPFDTRLSMSQAINECVAEVSWKTRALVRTQRFHTDSDLLNLWKAHILSYIEYRTPAWYHACETTIAPLDRCLSSFLRKIGVDDITALMKFNLAPLHTRRDMAMLAVIHRAALRKGPPAFHAFIRHSAQENRASDRLSIGRVSRILVEYRNCGNRLEIMRRSLFGLISVYNLLPESVIIYSTVQEFQRALQDFVKDCVTKRGTHWFRMLSPRGQFAQHMLRQL